jgi:hypothetical protein
MFTRGTSNLLPVISNKFRKTDTNLVYLFTNARDEPNIAEWISHHLLLGFDKIYVFDHLSKESIKSKLQNKFGNKLEVINVTGSGNIKHTLMTKAIEICQSKNVSWMLYLDADEFLLLNNCDNVKLFLEKNIFADALGINWLMFGSSNHINQPKGLITENFIMSDKLLNDHVKSFVRPLQVRMVKDPHSYIIHNPNRYYAMTGNRMAQGAFNPIKIIFTRAPAYIAHYIVQSESEFKRRKGRPMDDGSGIKRGLYSEIHKVHNEVPNNQLQYKYSNRIKEYLNKININL